MARRWEEVRAEARGVRLVDEQRVAAVRAQMVEQIRAFATSEWITQAAAAEILGVGYSAVTKMVARGALTTRGAARYLPSLNCAEVEQFAAERAEERARKAAAPEPKPTGPPDSDHDWLTVPQTADVVGITRQTMHRRLQRDRLPYVWFGGIRWIRRDLLEMSERARAAHRGQKS